MKNIFGVTYNDLETYFINNGDKKFRATQLYDFLYKKRVYDLNVMNNIPNTTKEKLKTDFDFSFIKILKKQEDEDVKKYLDGFKIMYNNLKNILNKFEIHEIDWLNKEFDHNTSQALMMEHRDGVAPGMVIEVLQKGYMIKDKLLRAALVKVSEWKI